jgi:hypothetical protein
MNSLDARRAIEALRSGVPSAAAVREIGCGQPMLERRFREVLAKSDLDGGMLVRAGYGEGKSHFLTCLEREALDAGYAASRLVISKSIPLSDPAKLLSAAAEGLRVGVDIGRGLDEVQDRLILRLDSPQFVDFKVSLERDGLFDSRFPATVSLFEDSRDDEFRDRILRFWAGDALTVGEIRRGLKGMGMAASYPLAPIRARDLAIQKLAFIPALMKAAGLEGWVLLIDEVELVGQYSRLQRARSYAELTRLLTDVPGITTVAAISSDFSQAVLDAKGDRDGLAAYLEGRYPELIGPAEKGMELIDRADLFEVPGEDSRKRAFSALRRLHGDAYGWQPPEITWPETVGVTPMRTFVRAWISAWDMRRLNPGTRPDEAGFEISPPVLDYGEEADPGVNDETSTSWGPTSRGFGS